METADVSESSSDIKAPHQLEGILQLTSETTTAWTPTQYSGSGNNSVVTVFFLYVMLNLQNTLSNSFFITIHINNTFFKTVLEEYL